MLDSKTAEIGLKKLQPVKRKSVSLSGKELVEANHLSPHKALPLVIQPAIKDINLIDWVTLDYESLSARLNQYGALLFRNFNLHGVTDFESFASAAAASELLEYRERSSPRSQVAGNVYTSTDYPADQSIFLHNENSYQHTWPLKIFFYAQVAPEQGGETPIADTRRIFQSISPEIRQRFKEKKWMYVRNFSERFGLPWQTVFQTTDKRQVEEYCRKNDIQVEWKNDNRLTTRAIRPAMMKHPRTGEDIWFNHATFFHVTTLAPTLRQVFSTGFSKEDIPTNSYYGDGSDIEPSVLDELRNVYHKETVSFPWQQGDILMLDNMLVAHGRSPYSGPRKILVAMAEPFSHASK